MTHTTPAVTTLTCDFCKRENPPMKKRGRVRVEQAALDYLGDPAADASYALDACDECIEKVNRCMEDMRP